MLGIVLLLILSFVAIYLYSNRIFDAIGIIPRGENSFYFFFGFVLISSVAILTICLESIITAIRWTAVPTDSTIIVKAAIYYFKGAVTEELVFRGALLYILVKKIGSAKACIVSAVLFGGYHYFSYGMSAAGFIPILYVFTITALSGLTWAYAFSKSNTILLPLGLHFGWNFINSLFRSSHPYGELLYKQISGENLSDIGSLLMSIFTGIFPTLLTFAILHLFFRTKKKYRPL